MLRWYLQTLNVLAVLLFTAGAAGASDVYLALDTAGEGSYTVDGRFWTPGEPSGAWTVLTDYDHLPSFIPSLKKSQVEQRSADSLMLRQEAVGRALGVLHRRIHVLLKVREQPNQEIAFEDLSHYDFLSYRGFWQIEPAAGGGSWVNYHLAAQPNFFAPAFVARKSFQKMARELLLSVQTEIMRRGNLSDTLLCCPEH